VHSTLRFGVTDYAIATRDLGKREGDVVDAGSSTRFNATPP